MRALLSDLAEGIKDGELMAILDPDGEIRYIHEAHYNGQPIASDEALKASQDQTLFGTSLS